MIAMPNPHDRSSRSEDEAPRAAAPATPFDSPRVRRFVLSLLSVFTLSAGDAAAPQLYGKAVSAREDHARAPGPSATTPPARWRRILSGCLRVLAASTLTLFGMLVFVGPNLDRYPLTPTVLIPWLPHGVLGLVAWFLAASCACGGLLRLASRIDGAR